MTHRNLLRVLSALCLLTTLLPGLAAPAAGQCPGGVSGVTVELLSAGSADGSKERREHAFISETLAQALGIAGRIDPDEDVNPQIRAVVDLPVNTGGPSLSANFTVAGTFTDTTDHVIRVYAWEDDDDEDSGQWKLVGEHTQNPAVSQLELTLHAFATSVSTIDGVAQTNFCEPAGNDPDDERFVESSSTAAADKQVAILVPHGGDIEGDTSDMGVTLRARLTAHGVTADWWYADGTWDDDVSERWHITAGAIDPASFPALEALFDEPDYQTGVPYRYAVAYHGFLLHAPGIVFGGQAHRDEKCYAVQRIQELLATQGRSGDVAFYLFDVDEQDLSIPNRQGLRIEAERDVRGLRGLDDDNVVNRLSPNDDGLAGRGAFQLEISNGLRDEAFLMDSVSEGIGDALAALIADPAVAVDACAALTTGDAGIAADVFAATSPSTNSIHRREHARISKALADALGIAEADLDAEGRRSPQIRLVVTSPPLERSGWSSSAVFTVVAIDPDDTAAWAEVYPRYFAGDVNSGEHKLLTGLKGGTITAEAYRIAVSSSELETVDDGDHEWLSVHAYPETTVSASAGLTESGKLVDERDFVMIVPQGGTIFEGILEQVPAVVARFDAATGGEASFWTVDGRWGGNTVEAFARWFVHPRHFDAASFPILDRLLDGEYSNWDVPFRYAASFHGMSGGQHEVVVGGQSDRTEKCFVVSEIAAELAAANIGLVALYVEDPGGDVSVPNDQGAEVDPLRAFGLGGLDPDDVLARLSPNPTRTAGRGTFMIGESSGVRNDVTIRTEVAEGLADAMATLVTTGVPSGFTCSSL